MPRGKSVTSSDSFRARMLQAERWRLALMAGCLFVMMGLWIARRALGGVVASVDAVFIEVAAVLAAGMILMGVGYWDVTRRIRTGGTMSTARATASAVVDLGVPLGCLLLFQEGSPRGAYTALSGPTLLLMPIVVLLSVLRLRPAFSLALGVAAGLLHWALAARVIRIEQLPAGTWPAVLSYGALLALTGVAAAVLAVIVRRYIEEAVSESEAAERASRTLVQIEHELDIARTIQMGLLPAESPKLSSFEIAAMARPASQAGGDYYDWQELPDGRAVVAIADVTGHGIGPALVMAVCRAYARATAPSSGSAKELLERLNRLIAEDLKGQRFITMAVAILDATGDLELLSAGHGPTYVHRAATRDMERFGGNGLPLGVLNDETFDPTTRLRLEPGDALVLLTDGFMEQPAPDGTQFGRAGLERVIRAHGRGTADELLRAIDAAVVEHSSGRLQTDDMTAVIVKRR